MAAASAGPASQTVTYGATVSIPAPPSSNFAGASGGGDGWSVVLSSTQIFNVFHHQQTLKVNCHNQADASSCWGSYKTVTDAGGDNFSTSAQPGMYLDQATGHLYVFATRLSDYTAGVVCVDTLSLSADPFCGFTALSGVGDAPDSIGWSGVTDPVLVGHDWYAFNYVPGTPTGTEDQLLCFNTSTDAACASQPYAIDYGGGNVSSVSPAPGIMAMNSDVVIQLPTPSGNMLACLDTTSDTGCSGSWPATAASAFIGDPVPVLSAAGATTGVCTGNWSCFDTNGGALATPAGLASAISNTIAWNGGAVVIGRRIYVPEAGSNSVGCYDYSTSAGCANFPKTFSGLSTLYTVSPDPQRPSCLWVNADGGSSQIQNFDAYTGGTCANAPLRIQAASLVATNNSVCVPATWNSLQVQNPLPSDYTSGSVDFDNSDGNPISGVSTHTLDATGTTSLTDLNLSSTDALPQFVITLAGLTGSPGTVDVHVTWAGTYDPACVQGTTAVTTATAPGQPAPPTVAAGDGTATVSWTAPASDGYSPITGYTVNAYDAGGTPAGNCSAAAPATSCQVPGLAGGDYTFTVTAANAVGSATSTASGATLPAPPTVPDATLSGATVGYGYSATLTVDGGVGPYSWSVTSGTVPTGLSLAGDGTLTGTPNAAGTSSFTARVTDGGGLSASGTITLGVGYPQPPTVAAQTLLPAATAGGAYRAALTAGGGRAPYAWTLAGGSLPPGLSLNSDGTISGAPTTAGTYTFAVTVTDGNGLTATENASVTVKAAPTLPKGGTTTIVSPGTSLQNTLTPSGGTGPYTWSVASGKLPPGVSLNPATGTLEGMSTLPGSYTATVKVTDANGVTATETITLTVAPTNVNTRPIASTPDGHGYWLANPQGGVDTFGNATDYGSMAGKSLHAPIVGIESTPTGHGYWMVGADGGVFTFGDAAYYGSASETHLAAPVLGLIPTIDGHGYWLVSAGGGVLTYGDARYYGGHGGQPLVAPMVGMVATTDNKGYWLVAADGGVFAYGDARYYGSASGIHLAARIVGMASTPTGHGYSLVGADGGVFTFGDAHFYGSATNIHLVAPMDGIQPSPDGHGYWLVARDGGVFAYGNAGFTGSVPGRGSSYN